MSPLPCLVQSWGNSLYRQAFKTNRSSLCPGGWCRAEEIPWRNTEASRPTNRPAWGSLDLVRFRPHICKESRVLE